MEQKIECIQNVGNHHIRSKNCFDGGPLGLHHGYPQSGLFEHQPVISTISHADGTIETQSLDIAQLRPSLLFAGNDRDPARDAGKGFPDASKCVGGQDMNFKMCRELLKAISDSGDEVAIAGYGSVIVQDQMGKMQWPLEAGNLNLEHDQISSIHCLEDIFNELFECFSTLQVLSGYFLFDASLPEDIDLIGQASRLAEAV